MHCPINHHATNPWYVLIIKNMVLIVPSTPLALSPLPQLPTYPLDSDLTLSSTTGYLYPVDRAYCIITWFHKSTCNLNPIHNLTTTFNADGMSGE